MARIQIITLDDNPLDREIMKIACGILDIDCESYGKYEEFIYNCPYYDGCILDYLMPRKNGIQVAQDIRKILPNYPIMFMTGMDESSDEWAAMDQFGIVTRKGLIDSTMDSLKKFIRQINASGYKKQVKFAQKTDGSVLDQKQ